MQLYLVESNADSRPLHQFLDSVSEGLRLKIYNKLQSYIAHGDVYHCKSLKALNARIWKYKGTIYKLRVDSGRESARVLFARTKQGDLVVVHAFLKSTRKTPAKDAHQAIALYRDLERLNTVRWAEQ